IGSSWRWLPAIAGLAMFGVRIWRPARETRGAWLALAASFALAGPVLIAHFNIDPHGIGLYICRRFHILPTLLLTVPVASALDVACARLANVVRPRTLAALPGVGFVALALAALPGLARTHGPAMERGVQNLLVSLPATAIVVVVSEDQCFGVRYLQLT